MLVSSVKVRNNKHNTVRFISEAIFDISLLEFNNVVMYNYSFYKTKTSKTIKLANNKNVEI